MTAHQPLPLLKEQAREVELATILPPLAPPAPNRGSRTFDLHPAVHMMVIGAYAAFAAILCTAFMAPDLVVPAGIVVVSIIALFATPAFWARVQPRDELPRQSWAEFLHEGVDCLTGRLTAGQALAQILVLPAMLIALAITIAVIKATV
jgi:hypothetical protein